MYLVSDSAHMPMAVFSQESKAINYLCALNQVAIKYSCIDPIPGHPTMFRVYTEAYPENLEKTLGYVRGGVQIDPHFS